MGGGEDYANFNYFQEPFGVCGLWLAISLGGEYQVPTSKLLLVLVVVTFHLILNIY